MRTAQLRASINEIQMLSQKSDRLIEIIAFLSRTKSLEAKEKQQELMRIYPELKDCVQALKEIITSVDMD